MNVYKPRKNIDKKNWPFWLKSAVEYIDHNYEKKLTLDEIARIANLSRYHFCRLFKKLMGQTVFAYIISVRIDKAKELLNTSTFNVSEICYKVGFKDLSYFINTFKKVVGTPPLAYRNNIRNSNILQK